MTQQSRIWALALCGLLLFTGCYKGEADRLKKQLAVAQQENEELKKKIELLSGTVKQLADLQVLNQSSEQKREEAQKSDAQRSE